MSKQVLANVLVAEGKQNTKFYKELGAVGKKMDVETAHNNMKNCNFKQLSTDELKKLKRIKFKHGSYTKGIEQALLVQSKETEKKAVKPTSQARRSTEPR
jgi:hypothetical protein